jgi:hypothetical protein
MNIFSGSSSESLYRQWIQRIQNEFDGDELQELRNQHRGCFFSEDYHAIYDQVLKQQHAENGIFNLPLTLRYHLDNIVPEAVKLLPHLLKNGVDEIVLFRDFSTPKELLDLVVKLIPIEQLIVPVKMDFANDVQIPENPTFYHILAFSEGTSSILRHISAIKTENSEVWILANASSDFYELLALLRSIKILDTSFNNDFHIHLICDLHKENKF